MKVLIVHQHFKSPQHGGAIRSWYLAKALVEKGVETVVITAHNEPGYRRATVDGIDVHYLPVSYDNRFGFYRRLYSFWTFARKVARLAGAHRDADLLYAISTPLTTGLAARLIRRRYGIPYIFEVGDLWPEAPVQLGAIQNPLLKWVLYRMEKRIYRRSIAVVALSLPIKAAIAEKVPGKKIYLLPNMSDTDFYNPEPPLPPLCGKFGVTGKFVVSYLGAMGLANGLHFLLDCAAACQEEAPDVHFLLCGDGATSAGLRADAAERSLHNVSFLGFLNREGVAEVMNVSSAVFISYLPVPVLETGSPNKYFDGLAAGKLILINFGGWIKEELERERCGLFIDPKNAADFVKQIKAFLEDKSLLGQYQARARSLAERKYSRQMLGDRFFRIVTGETGSSSAI